METQIGDIDSQLASQGPIQDLPLELLQLIFDHTLPYAYFSVREKGIKALRLVCRSWWLAVDNTPTLWSHLSDAYPVAWVRRCLSNSGEVPLTVGLGYNMPGRRGESARLLKSVKHRWHDATYWSMISARSIPEEDLTGFGPNLKHFQVSGLQPSSSIPLFTSGTPPSLHSLTLRQVIIPWDSPVLLSGSLQHLNLSAMDESPPSLTNIMSILRSSPGLQTLCLRPLRCSSFPPLGLSTNPSAKVPLENLSSIELKAPANHIRHLFSQLYIPHCQSVAFEWADSPRRGSAPRGPDLTQEFLQFLNERIPQPTTSVRITIPDRHIIKLVLPSPRLTMTLTMEPSHLQDVARLGLKDARNVPTELIWDRLEKAEKEDLLDIDAAFPRITDLKITARGQDALKSLLVCLSSGNRQAFRNLQRLHISYQPEILDDLKAVVESWNRRGGAARTILLSGASSQVIQELTILYPEFRTTLKIK